MVQLIAIIVKQITQRHKYRWHVITEKCILGLIHKIINVHVCPVLFLN